MRILGIDASVHSTGICVCDCRFDENRREFFENYLMNQEFHDVGQIHREIQLLETKTFQTEENIRLEIGRCQRRRGKEKKEHGFYSATEKNIQERLFLQACEYQISEIMKRVEKYKPDIILIEDYAYAAKGSICQLAEMKGILKSHLYKTDIPIFFVNICEIKKVVTGNGTAQKEFIVESLKRFFTLDLEDRFDEADAIGLCLTGFYSIFHSLYKLNILTEGLTSAQKNSWRKTLTNLKKLLGMKEELQTWMNI